MLYSVLPGGGRPAQPGGSAEGAGGEPEEPDLLQHLQLCPGRGLEQVNVWTPLDWTMAK